MMIIDFVKPQERVKSLFMSDSQLRVEAAKKDIKYGFMLVDKGTEVLYDERLISRVCKALFNHMQ